MYKTMLKFIFPEKPTKTRIFTRVICDSLRYEHLEFFEKIKRTHNNAELWVGVELRSDISYSRRCAILENCKLVDKVVRDDPLIIDIDFLERNKIDLVIYNETSI